MHRSVYKLKDAIVKSGCKISIIFLMISFCLNAQAQQYLITTAVGIGSQGYSGDGGLAIASEIYSPLGITCDALGNLYIADSYNQRVRKVNVSTGIITTIAGSGVVGYSGDGGIATAAKLNYPIGLSTDPQGNLYIADYLNNRIRKVSTNGIITTIAGNGTAGYSGDGGLATAAKLNNPRGVTVDALGNLYIADYANNRIRKVNTNGIITTITGNGNAGYSGDGGIFMSAELNHPTDVKIDVSGNLYIADMENHRVRKVTASNGIITTIAGNGTASYWGDGVPATASILYYPISVALDTQGNVYVGDSWNSRVRKITASTGIMATIAGNGFGGNSGDGGIATNANLNHIGNVAVNAQGNVYIVDGSNRVRKLTPCATVTTPVNHYVVCGSGNSIMLSVVGATSHAWSTGQESSIITIAPTTNTSYVVTYTDNVGCVSVKNINVFVSDLPIISVNSTSICNGNSTVLSPSGASTYSITGGSFTVSPNITTSYSVTGTNALGCAASNTAVATVSVALPNVIIISDSVICENNETAIMSASGASTYTWSYVSENGTTLIYGTSIGLIPENGASYIVQGADENGCINTASITLRMDACTGIYAFKNESSMFKIYPNPVIEILNFENLGINKELLVSFIDMLGQEIKQINIEKEIDIKDLPSGIYVLRITSENKIIHQQKLIKK